MAKRYRVLSMMLVLLVALCACKKKNATPTQPSPATVVSVAVSSDRTSIEVGQSVTMSARATYSDGTQADISGSWSSDNTSVATVDASRVVRAVSVGTATIIARADNGVTGTRAISVTAPPAPVVVSVIVTLDKTSIEVGQTATATARGTLSDGTQADITATWSSDNTAVATVNSARTVRGIAPGSASIIARAANGVTGARLVSVVAATPKTEFGPGSYRVNTDIQAGRYFAAPPTIGCYWERKSGFGGTFAEIIANDAMLFRPVQTIVDILSTDAGFESDSDCGTWFNTPRAGAQTTIRPGKWLVGTQLPPGTYRIDAGAGCYWERLRDFRGTIASIIANEFLLNGGQQLITIAASDVGFSNDGDCGTWAPVSVPSHFDESQKRQAPDEILRNREAQRAQEPAWR